MQIKLYISNHKESLDHFGGSMDLQRKFHHEAFDKLLTVLHNLKAIPLELHSKGWRIRFVKAETADGVKTLTYKFKGV